MPTTTDSHPGYIWQPFTQMKTADPPIHISQGKGALLFAADGKSYIDAISSWWVNIHGHANEIIAKAIAKQALELEHVIFAGFTHTPAIELSENLIKILPGNLSRIFFSDNGSTSVEVAIKMAIQYWHNQGITKKTKIIAFENAYHGDTFGAMSAGARSAFSAAFDPLLFDVIHIPTPDEHNIAALVANLDDIAKDDDIAAFIYEPLVQGAAGMLMHEAKWLDDLVAAMKQRQIICIADEVMTGFGRTGKNFATEYLHHKADIICVSKGITGGFLPLGITACSQEIFDAFYADDVYKTFYHGHSYTGNPLSCAAANASIALLLDEKCQASIQAITESHQGFQRVITGHSFVKNIRQQGTILAFDLNTPEHTSYFNPIKKEAYHFYLEKGVLLRPLGNTVYIMPPYCISDIELKQVYDIILQSLDWLEKKYV